MDSLHALVLDMLVEGNWHFSALLEKFTAIPDFAQDQSLSFSLQTILKDVYKRQASDKATTDEFVKLRNEARSYEHGEGVPKDPVRAASLYCEGARYGLSLIHI